VTAWTNDEFTRIGDAEELQVASLRRDGTLGSPRTIWVVPYGDDLYVRSVNGSTAVWFRGTQVRHEGHIRAGASTPMSPSQTLTTPSTTRSMLPTGPSITGTQRASPTPSPAPVLVPRRPGSGRRLALGPLPQGLRGDGTGVCRAPAARRPLRHVAVGNQRKLDAAEQLAELAEKAGMTRQPLIFG
jgi:hypothetical protein